MVFKPTFNYVNMAMTYHVKVSINKAKVKARAVIGTGASKSQIIFIITLLNGSHKDNYVQLKYLLQESPWWQQCQRYQGKLQNTDTWPVKYGEAYPHTIKQHQTVVFDIM